MYLSKIPMTAVDLLHDRVLPVYETAGITLELVFSDIGGEFCGRPLCQLGGRWLRSTLRAGRARKGSLDRPRRYRSGTRLV